MFDISKLSPIELLKLNDEIIDELIIRGIAQTRNQPVSEYAKWLVLERLGLNRISNPSERYDGVDKSGKKFLIKSRHIVDTRQIQFGVIRDIKDKNFDFLVAISFGKDYEIIEAYIIPIEVLLENQNYNAHQNGYILKLKDLKLSDQRIKDIKPLLFK